jgi:lysophospholipase L1-like esterase
MRKLALILLFNLSILAAVELGLRAAAGLEWLSLPPAGLAGIDAFVPEASASVEKRLYVPDRNLIRRMQPNFHMVYPARALFPGRDDSYEVNTNERGFRTPPFQTAKRAGVFRIACMGDSSTFGFQVDDGDAYPQVLARLLEESHPGRFEILNLGAPGYTTRQGIELLRREVLAYRPDLVTFAYGTNDRFFGSRMTDDALIRFNQSAIGTLSYHVSEALDRTYTYRMLKQLAARFASRPSAQRAGGGSRKRRVSGTEMHESIATAKRLLAEQGASLLLIGNDFARTDAIRILATAAEETGVELLDMRALLDDVRHERSRGFEEKLALHATEPPPGKFLLRVVAPGKEEVVVQAVRFARPGVEVAMHDDGQNGDQRPGDGVWSAYLDGRAGHKVTYSYWRKTESGLVKEYQENSMLPLARAEVVPDSRVCDIDVFGDYYLKSDGSHPDEEGHRLIAKRLHDHVLGRDDVKSFLAGAGRGAS